MLKLNLVLSSQTEAKTDDANARYIDYCAVSNRIQASEGNLTLNVSFLDFLVRTG